ncbi:MAG: 4-hydroxythreonine-4-phosphate dehydrogenase PdxA [Parahaliea sp.]
MSTVTVTPTIAITTGEPAGIGPDITIMAAQKPWDASLVAIADPDLLQARAARLGLPLLIETYDRQKPPQKHHPGRLQVLPFTVAAPVQTGVLNVRNAHYVLATLQAAVEGCRHGHFQAMVTAPVQKSIINDAGIPFSGHTEFLAEKTQTNRVVMMLATQNLRVALVTTHLPLSQVSAAITPETLEQTIHILHTDLQHKFGLNTPHIAVLGLNPHAGEGGHMGREEIEVITPVVEKLRAGGLQLTGPLPADTAFNPTMLAQVDTFLAMYHDQGLPVLKYAGFGKAINITLGLPLIRTSVDHGTALDLAGSGKADGSSLELAIALASKLAQTHAGNNLHDGQ